MTLTTTSAGLTDAEVAQRVADGKTNDVPTRAARSVSDEIIESFANRENPQRKAVENRIARAMHAGSMQDSPL